MSKRQSRKIGIAQYMIPSLKDVFDVLSKKDGILVKKENNIYFFETGTTTTRVFQVWARNRKTGRYEYYWTEQD